MCDAYNRGIDACIDQLNTRPQDTESNSADPFMDLVNKQYIEKIESQLAAVTQELEQVTVSLLSISEMHIESHEDAIEMRCIASQALATNDKEKDSE